MTTAAGTQSLVPRVIVVGPPDLHAQLAAHPNEWDAQAPVIDTAALWSAFASGAVDPASPFVVFAAAAASAEQIAGAIIAMLPTAKPFVLVDNIAQLLPYQQAVLSAATGAGADASVVSWAATPYDLVAVLRSHVAAAKSAETSNMIMVDDVSVTSFEPSDVALPPAPEVQPFQPAAAPVAPAPVAPAAAPAPAAAAVAPTPAPTAHVPANQGVQATVVGSPAAAHLPTLNVVAVAAALTDADKSVPPPPPLAGQTTVAVTSSKGGSGKSTTALMLATTVAQSSIAAGRPLKVALVDLDARDGQVSTLIGTYLPTAYNLWTAQAWDVEAVARAMVHVDDLSIDCLLAPARPRTSQGVGTEFYRHVIRVLRSMYDVVILDTSANYLDPATWEVALVESTSILLVTTLANTSIQGMSRAVRDITDSVEVGGLGIGRENLSIVVNQSVAGVGVDMEFIVQAALHVPIVAAVPMATRDVLLATNHSAMQALLKHPYLGPAYFGLARAIFPQLNLVPLVAEGSGGDSLGQTVSHSGDDTSARETGSAVVDELSSVSATSNDATTQAVTSVLGS